MHRNATTLAAITFAGLATAGWAASCPDGSIAMYVSGQGEFCPDPAGRYTVRVSSPSAPIASSPPATPLPSVPAHAPATAPDGVERVGRTRAAAPPTPAVAFPTSAPQSASGPTQSGNVRLLQACRNLGCHVQEGYQAGLTTVEVKGQAPQYEGRSLDFVVADAVSRRTVLQRKVGVMIGGGFTTSIPAYNLPAGRYVFGFSPVGGGQTIGAGLFAVGSGGNLSTPAANSPTLTNKHQQAHASGGVVGTWHGVGGTLGKIELHPDGTYTSNGAPAGSYQVSGNQVIFTGNLAAWNNGHATLKRADLMEFYWKNPSGGINYFAFGKY